MNKHELVDRLMAELDNIDEADCIQIVSKLEELNALNKLWRPSTTVPKIMVLPQTTYIRDTFFSGNIFLDEEECCYKDDEGRVIITGKNLTDLGRKLDKKKSK